MRQGGVIVRELSVFYCQHCGYYAYYQLKQNAVCPKCNIPMTQLKIRYQDFMDLGHRERDLLISENIIQVNPYVQRLIDPHKKANDREQLGKLAHRIEELELENQELQQTIEWMHSTIWDLLRKNKLLKDTNTSL